MTASRVHEAVQDGPAAVRNGTRLARTLLCLAIVAFLVVALRLGVYEYFHGEGHVLRWLWSASSS